MKKIGILLLALISSFLLLLNSNFNSEIKEVEAKSTSISVGDDQYVVVYNPNGGSLLDGNISIYSNNLISPDTYGTKSAENVGISYTDNGDGTITASGTASELSAFYVLGAYNVSEIPAGTYYLSGAPVLNREEGVCLRNDYGYYNDTGNGVVCSYLKDTPDAFKIRIGKDEKVDNATFAPSLQKISLATHDRKLTLEDNKFVRNGYRFIGWNTQPDGSGISFERQQPVENLAKVGEEITLYAMWEPTFYSVNYNPNGGSLSTQNVNIYSNNLISYPFADKNPQPYYGVTYTDNGDGSVTFVGATENYCSEYELWVDVTLPAGTYHLSGCNNLVEGVSIQFDGFANIADKSKLIGSVIDKGYGTTFTLTDTVTFSRIKIRVDKNTVINEPLTFTPSLVRISNHTYDESFELATNVFSRDGYTFTGWNTKPDGSGVSYTDNQPVENLTTVGEEITLYAQWKSAGYQIIYNPNGGSIADGSVSNTTENLIPSSFADKNPQPYFGITYTNNGDGTVTFNGRTTTDLSNYDLWLNVTLPAGTYHLSGCNGGVSGVSIQFDGFNNIGDDSKLIGSVIDNGNGTTFTLTDTVTFSRLKIRVKEGTNVSTPLTFEPSLIRLSNHAFDESKPLAKNEFAKDYHTFLGWSTDPNATTPTYLDGEVVENLTLVEGETITLYAVWRENVVNVVYNPNGADEILVWDKNGYKPNMDVKDSTYIDYANESVEEFNKALHTLYEFKMNLNDGYGYYPLRFNAFKDETGNNNYRNGLIDGKNDWELLLYKKGFYWVNYWYVGDLKGNIEDVGLYQHVDKYFTNEEINNRAFNGVFLAELCGVKEQFKQGDVTVHLYAYWRPIEYKVNFYANEGSGNMPSLTGVKYGTTYTLPSNTFTRAGYTFIGWNTKADGSGVFYQDEEEILNLSFENGAVIDLYAQWASNTYTIKFVNNDGTDSYTSYNATFDLPFTISHSITRYYCTFKGWATSPDGEVVYKNGDKVTNLTSVVDGIVTLYAVWEQHKVYINYHPNGATVVKIWDIKAYNPSGESPVEQIDFTNNTIEEINAALKELYAFKLTLKDDWAYNPTVFNAYEEEAGNRNYWWGLANGKNDYELSLAKLGYYWNGKWILGSPDGTIEIVDEPTEEQRNNKSFNGIYIASLCGKEAELKAGDITIDLYASWTPITYTVNFDSNGGAGDMDSMTMQYDQVYTLSSNKFSKDGYVFKGWATSKNGGVVYSDEQTVYKLSSTLNAKITLYAVWEANEYTIVYNPNGGTGSMSSVTLSYNDKFTLNTNTFVRDGYTFIGWNTKSNGNGISFNNQQTVKNLVSAGEEITLYAQWKPITYKVVYDANGGYIVDTPNNLIPFPYSGASTSGSKVTFTNNGDGSITFSGHAVDKDGNNLTTVYELWINFTLTPGTYYLSGCVNTIDGVRMQFDLAAGFDSSTFIGSKIDNGEGTVFTLTDTCTFSRLKIRIEGGIEVSEPLTFYPSLVKLNDYTYGELKPLQDNLFARDYHSFLGWSTDPNATTPMYLDGEAVDNLTTTDGAVVKLYAVWKVNTVTVIYHRNSADTASYQGKDFTNKTDEELNAEFMAYSQTVRQEHNPVTFVPDVEGIYGLMNGNSPDSLNMTRKGYTEGVTWYIGDAFGNITNIGLNQDIIYQNNLVQQYADDKDYLNLGGFNGKYLAKKANMTEEYKNGDITIHLYYKWNPIEYSVSYNSGNLLTGLNDIGLTTSSTIKYSISNGVVTVIANRAANDNEGKDSYGYTTGRVKLEAGKTYRFSCDYNCSESGTGWGNTNSHQVHAYLMKEGNTAKYYFMSKNPHSFTVDDPGIYMLRLDVNLQGQTAEFYNICIVEEAISTQNVQTFKYDVSETLNPNIYTKAGYTFVGWNTKPDGTGDFFKDGEVIKNLASTQGEVIPLYAIWTSAPTTNVTFKANGGSGSDVVQDMNSGYLSVNTFTRDYYTFLGWSTNPDGPINIFSGKTFVGTDEALTDLWYKDKNNWGYHKLNDGSFDTTSGRFSTKQKGTAQNKTDNPDKYDTAITFDATIDLGSTYVLTKMKIYYYSNKQYAGENFTVEIYQNGVWKIASSFTQSSVYTKSDSHGGYIELDLGNETATQVRISCKDAVSGYSISINEIECYGVLADNAHITLSANTTLYATWRQNTVTVLYDPNGATNISVAGSNINFADYSFEEFNLYLQEYYKNKVAKDMANGSQWACNPTLFNAFSEVEGNYNYQHGLANVNNINEVYLTRTGYTPYVSWYTAAVGGTGINQSPTAPQQADKSFNGLFLAKTCNKENDLKNGDIFVTLYAHYYVHNYDIIFDANEGTGTMNSIYATYDTPYALLRNTFTREGYSFVGWNTERDGSGTSYADCESVLNLTDVKDGEVTLYAQWVSTYTVVYNPNGGSLTPGWSTTSDNLIPFPYYQNTTTINGITYTVNADGSVVVNGTATANSALSVWGHENSLLLPKGTYHISGAPIEGGTYAVFTNHNFTPDKTDIGYGATFTLTEDTRISFKIRIANGTTVNNLVFYPSVVKVSTHAYNESKALDSNMYVREGYTFAGWATNPNGNVVYSDKKVVNNLVGVGEEITLYAKWTPITYKISFKNNGGEGSMSSMTGVKYDSSIILTSNTFTKEGYRFVGWNTMADGTGNMYLDGASVKNLTTTSNGEIVLYAQWKLNSYKIAFNDNGGSGKMPVMEAVRGQTYILLPNTFVRDGYTFVGWNTKADGTGSAYKNEAEVMNLALNNGQTVTLYAQWEQFDSSVDFLIYYYEQSGTYKTLYLGVQMVINDTNNTLKNKNYTYIFSVYNLDKNSKLVASNEGAIINGNKIICGEDLELTNFEENYYGVLTIFDGDSIICETKTNTFSVNSIAHDYLNNKTLLDKDRAFIETIPTAAPVRIISKYSTGEIISDETTYYPREQFGETITFYTIPVIEDATYEYHKIYKGQKIGTFDNSYTAITTSIDVYGLTYEIVYTLKLGTGTKDDPVLIRNLDDLLRFRDEMKNTNGNTFGKGRYYKVVNDIDTLGKNVMIYTFAGTFDGDGHTISNLNISNTSSDNTGLFKLLTTDGTIKNLTVSGTVTGTQKRTAGIVGYNNGIIDNCVNNATIIGGTEQIGGIAGYSTGLVTNCVNNGSVSAGGFYVGGIVGDNRGGSVSNCHNYGGVHSTSNSVGGIVGLSEGLVSDSINYADVTGSYNVGGIVGETGINSTGVQNCINYGNVKATSYHEVLQSGESSDENRYSSVGGIVGYYAYKENSSITACSNYGQVTGSYAGIGGLVGFMKGNNIISSVNHGTVSSTNRYVGGIVGYVISGGSITDTHNLGDIKGVQNVGGIAGRVGELNPATGVINATLTINNCTNEGNINAIGWGSGGLVGYGQYVTINNCINRGNVNVTSQQIGGLVGTLYTSSEINGSVNYGNVTAYNQVGGITGYLVGKLYNCSNYGDITSTTHSTITLNGATMSCSLTGGIAGQCKTYEAGKTVSYCINYGNVYGSNFTGGIIGGFVEIPASRRGLTMDNCINNGNVYGSNYTAGIFGGIYIGVEPGTYDSNNIPKIFTLTITNSINNGEIYGESNVGGIFGRNIVAKVSNNEFVQNNDQLSAVTIKNCVNNEKVSGLDRVGGIAGFTKPAFTLDSCENTGEVSGNQYVGGIVGGNYGTLTNSTNYATVIGNINVGGIAGESSTLSYNKNYGDVQAISGPCGGIVGHVVYSGKTIADCQNYGYIRCCNTKETAQIYGYIDPEKTVTLTNNLSEGKVGHACKVDFKYTTDKLIATFIPSCQNPTLQRENTIEAYAEVTMSVSASGTTVLYYYDYKFNDKFITNQYGSSTATLTPVNGVVRVDAPKQSDSGLVPSHDYVMFAIDGETHSHLIYYSEVDVWDGTSVSTSLQGSGTQADPYLIQSGADLAYIKSVIDSITGGVGVNYLVNQYQGKYFKMTKSIDLNGANFQIGYHKGWNDYQGFAGVFDGNNCTIRGLAINTGSTTASLFATVQKDGVVKNLSVYGSAKSTSFGAAGVVGYLLGTLENVTSYVKVEGKDTVGGIVANAEHITSNLINCVNYGEVYATNYNIGGIAGSLGHNATKCINHGKVTGANFTGGIGGTTKTTGVISYCKNYGEINGNSNVGGIAGGLQKNMEYCENYGNVTGTTKHIGGIAGQAIGGSVTECVNNGNVSGPSIVGGIVGYTEVNVTSCINNGEVSGTSDIGGIVGQILKGTISSCTNNGSVTGTSANVGGILGSQTESNSVQISSCYNNGNVSAGHVTVTSGSSNTNYSRVGGIVGKLDKGTIDSCENHGSVTGTAYANGGIAGQITLVSVTNSVNYGIIEGGANTAGIVGRRENTGNNTDITNCVNRGFIDSKSWGSGGIVGYGARVNVSNCDNYGDVNGSGQIGGVFGTLYSPSTAVNCDNYGNVSALDQVGGVVGYLDTTIAKCNNYGNVMATDAGATMVGPIYGKYNRGNVVESYDLKEHKNASSYSMTSNVHYYDCGDSNCTLDHSHTNHTSANSCTVCGYNANQLLLKPGVWNSDGAWYAAYFFNGSGNTWVKMTDSNKDGVYEVNIPAAFSVRSDNDHTSDYNKVVFCRMKSSNKNTLAFSNCWNQTNDLPIFANSGDTYTITGWGSGDGAKSTGSWSVTNNHLDVFLSLQQNNTIYFTPTSAWKADKARFAVYAWIQVGSEKVETWVNMTDSDNDGTYQAELPAYYTNVVFCRMNPNTTANNFNDGVRWNQTPDLVRSERMNSCVMASGMNWNDIKVNWTQVVVNVANYTFRKTSTANTVEVTLYLAQGYYEFKVHQGSTWYGNDSTVTNKYTDLQMASDKNNTKFNAAGGYYTFKYNYSTKKLSVVYGSNTD